MKILLLNGNESDMFFVSKDDLIKYLSKEAPLEKPLSPDIVVINKEVSDSEETLAKEIGKNYNKPMALHEYLDTLKSMLNLIS
ncbi:MAG: hypothetical protein ACM3QX_07880 [Syntrophomonadaceae bacterium]